MKKSDHEHQPKGLCVAISLVGLCFVCLWGFFGYYGGLQTVYDLWGSNGYIKRADLREKVLPGETVDVSSLSRLSAGTVCIVGPYASHISGSDDPAVKVINLYLLSNKIVMSEGEMGFVYLLGDQVKVDRYHLYKDLHMVDNSALLTMKASRFPNAFVPSFCANIASAKLYKTEEYQIVLGK